MADITYLPSRDLLSAALEDVNQETNLEMRLDFYNKLAERVIEHSDELIELGLTQ